MYYNCLLDASVGCIDTKQKRESFHSLAGKKRIGNDLSCSSERVKFCFKVGTYCTGGKIRSLKILVVFFFSHQNRLHVDVVTFGVHCGFVWCM